MRASKIFKIILTKEIKEIALDGVFVAVGIIRLDREEWKLAFARISAKGAENSTESKN